MQPSRKGLFERFDPWGFVALVFVLALFCYWPALAGGVLWDDPAHLTRPGLRSWNGLLRIWTDPLSTQQYYPVIYSVFWIEHHLWGDSTVGYHLVNVLQHASAACLLAFVLRRIRTIQVSVVASGSSQSSRAIIPRGAEWVAALVFAVHPICVESVAWICEQKNTLSLIFYLAAAFAWLGYTASRRASAWVLATVLFVLALGTKTATVTLPPSLLVVVWWTHGRLDWKRDIRPLLPWFGIALAAGLVTAWAESSVLGAEGEAYALTLLERILLAGRVAWFYLASQFQPWDHSFFYPLWDVARQASSWVVHLVACAGITAGLFYIRKRTRGPLAVWLLFLGSLFPVLGFFNVFFFAFSYVADHFQYIATMCMVSGGAIGATLLASTRPKVFRTAGLALCAVLILAFAWLSRGLSGNYLSNETLARASIAQTPDNWMAHRLLAWTLTRDSGRDAEAIDHYEISLRLNPESPESLHGLAVLLARSEDRRSEVVGLLERALALYPEFEEAHYTLATELQKDPRRLAEAIEHYERAIEINPLLAPVHLQLANLISKNPERIPEALFHYEEALRLNPSYAEAHYRMGNILAQNPSTVPDAISHYQAALAIEPDAAPVHYGLGTVLATIPGRLPEALIHFEEALKIAPNMGWVHLTLAMHLTAIPGREEDVIRHAELGLKLEPGNLEARNGLAIFYVQQGRPGEARAHWMKALEIDPGYETARDNLRRLDQIENR